MEMRVSAHGRALIAQWEGTRLEVYEDSAGVPTIGVGHALTTSEQRSGEIWIGERFVEWKAGITAEDADLLLARDLEVAERSVARVVKIPLAQHQRDALVSLCFNIGLFNFENSTLVSELNAGRIADVPAQFRRWVFAAGHRSKGLEARREHEIALFEGRI